MNFFPILIYCKIVVNYYKISIHVYEHLSSQYNYISLRLRNCIYISLLHQILLYNVRISLYFFGYISLYI
jgi:hypothetical protein